MKTTPTENSDQFRHIRERPGRRRGNSFYLDRSARTPRTLCGGEPTIWDGDIRGAREAAREGWNVCSDCLNEHERRKNGKPTDGDVELADRRGGRDGLRPEL